MAWEQIGSGGPGELNDVVTLEANEVEEGQRARLDCQCLIPVATWQIDELRNTLNSQGVEELQINGSGTTVTVSWRKGFPWAAVIILALAAVIVIVLWNMFKDLPTPVVGVILLLGAGAAFLLAYNSVTQRRRQNG